MKRTNEINAQGDKARRAVTVKTNTLRRRKNTTALFNITQQSKEEFRTNSFYFTQY